MTPNDQPRWGRRLAAAAPALLAALGVAMAASSNVRPPVEMNAALIARLTGGDLSPAGLARLTGRMDAAQLALAERHDPNNRSVALQGLQPGWDSLTLAGKPSMDMGESGLDAMKLNAAMAATPGALKPARPFTLGPVADVDRRRALRCLTQAVYFEAALEPTSGQEAVAQVVLNRVRDPNYADSICGVVFEGAERSTGCQFSFTCDGALSQAPVAWAWNRAAVVAQRALAGHVAQQVGTATHYHADYVHPWWSPTLAKITQIGAHIFYRWKGIYGDTAAFRQPYAGREPVIDEARFARPRLVKPQAPTAQEIAAAMAAGTVVAEPAQTVEIGGVTRTLGAPGLGGRRAPTREDIQAINARIEAFESGVSGSAAPTAAPSAPDADRTGVTGMAVEEVGRPN